MPSRGPPRSNQDQLCHLELAGIAPVMLPMLRGYHMERVQRWEDRQPDFQHPFEACEFCSVLSDEEQTYWDFKELVEFFNFALCTSLGRSREMMSEIFGRKWLPIKRIHITRTRFEQIFKVGH